MAHNVIEVAAELHGRYVFQVLTELNNAMLSYLDLKASTIDILTKLQSGELGPNDYVVNKDGWQLVAPRPSAPEIDGLEAS